MGNKIFFLILLLNFVCACYADYGPYDTTQDILGMTNNMSLPFMKFITPSFKVLSGYFCLEWFPVIQSVYNGPTVMNFSCSVISDNGLIIQGQPVSIIISPYYPARKISYCYAATDFQMFSMICLYYLNLPTGTFFNFYTPIQSVVVYGGINTDVTPDIELSMLKTLSYNQEIDFKRLS